MTVRSVSFAYRNSIKLSAIDLDLVRTGKKSCTIRLGRLSVEKPQVKLTDGRDSILVKVTSIDSSKLWQDISDAEAILDGLEDKEQLSNDLQKYYGKIDNLQPMTIIYFEPV